MVLALIQNVALIVMLAVFQQYLRRRLPGRPVLMRLLAGVLYGGIAVIGMMTPFEFAPGLIYDGRSIILGLAGLLGGGPVAAIAAAIAAAHRLTLGGVGAAPGVATIVASAVLGTALRYWHRRRVREIRMPELLAFGVAIHVVMLFLQYALLPRDIGPEVVRSLAPVVLTLFPLATMFAARLILEQQEQDETRHELGREAQRLRLAMEASDQGTWDYDVPGDVLTFSPEAAHVLGYPAEELTLSREDWVETAHPNDRAQVRREVDELVAGRTDELRVRYRQRLADGTYRWFLSHGSTTEKDEVGQPRRVLGIVVDVNPAADAALALERRARESELLARTSTRLMSCQDAECVFSVIREFFTSLFPDDITIINEVTPDHSALVTRDLTGVSPTLLVAAEAMVGYSVIGRTFELHDDYRTTFTTGRMTRYPGMLDVTSSVLPAPIVRQLERTLGLHDFWTVGVADEGHAYASVHLIMRRPDVEVPTDVVESFAHLCFVAFARLEAATRLAESEEKFRTLVEQTNQGISVGSPDGAVLVYNRALEEISGYSREEVEREGWFSLAYPTKERRALALQLAQEAIAGDLPYVEVPIVRKDGEERWVSVVTTPVSFSGAVYNLSIFTDVTERRRAEDALRDSEARFRALVESAPQGIFVQVGYRFAYVNPAICRLYGATPEELIGQPTIERVRPDYRDMVLGRIRSVNEDRRPQTAMEYPQLRLDGSEFIGEVSGTPIVYGGADGAVVFVRDVTEERRAAEELERYRDGLEDRVAERTRELEEANAELARATKAKSQFLAHMSHELRTPLNSIIGFSSILMEEIAGPLNQEQHTQVGLVNSAGRHLLSIISDILDLSRVEAGKVRVEMRAFDAAAVVVETADVLRPLAIDKGVDLHISIPERPLQMTSDPAKIRQILLNLGGNAVKFTDSGRIEIGLEEADGNARFWVSDTGRGVPPDQLESIFESFSQVQRPEGPLGGSGLGLTISREFARLLGGDITVTSEVGRGSTFVLTLLISGAE